MRINTGVAATVFVATITGLGAAACASSERAATAATVAHAATKPLVPSMTEIYPSVPQTLPASEQGCGPKPLMEDVRVLSVSEADGTYRINGYVETLDCGPGVPDDTQFTDTGSVQSFVTSASTTYTLLGADPTKDYAVSAATFMTVADGPYDRTSALGFWGHICLLDFDRAGHVTSVQGVYTP
ncbi:hypothetical protein KDL01_19710 [Actinospica durhamensis]|uniref:Lipoprotein n=1 Tax=Actinospica durhamensis TaxID=1508375 RepID=A0A941IRP0_9ACTN|nr:hypothetical protein [Actinospica durhamensis]MBR7835512.1 hypothetical protein [Actinospica durhamensis]